MYANGLGQAPVTAYQVTRQVSSILDDPRFAFRRAQQSAELARRHVEEAVLEIEEPQPPELAPAVVVSPTGEVPPPDLVANGLPFGPDVVYMQPAVVGTAPGDVSVTVEGPDVAAAPRGFGMMEAAIAAGLAILLSSAWTRDRKRR